MNDKPPIAIIGTGVAGISSIKTIFEQIVEGIIDPKAISLAIFKGSDNVGIPYSLDGNLEYTINNEIAKMAIDGINPVKFIFDHKTPIIHYLKEHYPHHPDLNDVIYQIENIELEKNLYFPREIYGMYLLSIYNHYIKELKKIGVHVEEHDGPVRDINSLEKPGSPRQDIMTEKVEPIRTRRVGLFTGHGLPKNQSTHSPYSPNKEIKHKIYDFISSGQPTINFLIKGTSLSSNDSLLAIDRYIREFGGLSKGQKVNVTFTSRNLVLPSIRTIPFKEDFVYSQEVINECNNLEKQYLDGVISIEDFKKKLLQQADNTMKDMEKKIIAKNNLGIFKAKELSSPLQNLQQEYNNINHIDNRLQQSVCLYTVPTVLKIIEKMEQYNMSSAFKSEFYRYLAPMSPPMADKLLTIANNPSFNINYIKQDNKKKENYDCVIDASMVTPRIEHSTGLIRTLYDKGIVLSDGTIAAANPGVYSAALDKIYSSNAVLSSQYGKEATGKILQSLKDGDGNNNSGIFSAADMRAYVVNDISVPFDISLSRSRGI